MKRLLGTAAMVIGLSLSATAQGTGDRSMSGSGSGSMSGSSDVTSMNRMGTEVESDRDFDLGWLGLLGLAGLAGMRRRSHVHHTDTVGTGTHVHDHSRTDRI